MAENDQKPKGLRAPYLAGQKTIRSAFRNGRLLLQGAVVRAAHEGPQLIAHLAQIHTWFEAYRIDIDEG